MEALLHLSRHPVLVLAGRDRLARLAGPSTVRHLAGGEHLVRPGDPFTGVFVVARGVLAVTRRNRERKTRMLIGTMRAPGLMGDAELFADVKSWEMSVRAVEAITVVHVPKESFARWVADEPAVATGLYRDAATRLYLALELMQVFTLQKLENKILRLLWTASRPCGEVREAPLSPTQLAESLGVSARTIGRYLSQLEREGSIRRERGRIVLQISDEAAFEGRLGKRDIPSKWRLPISRDEGAAWA